MGETRSCGRQRCNACRRKLMPSENHVCPDVVRPLCQLCGGHLPRSVPVYSIKLACVLGGVLNGLCDTDMLQAARAISDDEMIACGCIECNPDTVFHLIT